MSVDHVGIELETAQTMGRQGRPGADVEEPVVLQRTRSSDVHGSFVSIAGDSSSSGRLQVDTSSGDRGEAITVKVEDILTEGCVASMKDLYLNVERLVLMIQREKNEDGMKVLEYLEAQVDENTRVVESIVAQSHRVAQFAEDIERVHRAVQARIRRDWSRVVEKVAELHESLDMEAEEKMGVTLRSALDSIGASVQDTDSFIRHNVILGEYVARCLDGLHSNDKRYGGRYILCVEQLLMKNVGMQSLLMALSDAYQGVRVLEEHGPLAKQVLQGLVHHQWKAPNTFNRVTKKFWILPKDVMKFKLAVMKHLPILVYGDRQNIMDVPPERLADVEQDLSCKDSGDVSSVYLDSMPSLMHYRERLHRKDQASVIRIRWYGDREASNDEKSIFVERKVHRSAYTGLSSVKERGSLKQKDVGDFIRGTYMVPEGKKDAVFLSSAMQDIQNDHQEIVMRTSYKRTAFQNSTENVVRISLDTNLCMTKEYNHGSFQSWCRDFSSSPLDTRDVSQFPYGVVEIKLQASPPAWVKDLVKTGILLVVPKFSKFLHGIASLYQEHTENVPYWFLPDPEDKDLLTPATWEEMADKEDVFEKHAADWLFPQGFEEPVKEEKHLNLAFFRPKKVNTISQNSQPLEAKQSVNVREAMDDLMDESGNRTWCDKETVDPMMFAERGDLITRKRTWTIYQRPFDAEHESACSEQTSSQEFISDSSQKQCSTPGNVSDVSAAERGAQHPKIQILPSDQTGSYAVMQYSMSSKVCPENPPNPSVERKRSSSLVRTRVEPKTFFANERTFLQWINISVLVMFLALSLLSGSSLAPGLGSSITTSCNTDDSKCLAGKMSGAIIAPVALAFMGYALFMYKKRTIQILRRETVRYDDQRGPVILVVILLLTMTIAYILTMIYVF